MKDTIVDLARVSAITENVLYIIGKSLQRRALRNGVLVALAYGSALVGVKLSQGGLTPQQIASLLVAASASYPLGTFLVLLIYLWGNSIYGQKVALLAATIAALSPNLLAHSKVATEEMGCTALMFASVWSLWRCLKAPLFSYWASSAALAAVLP